MFIELLKENEKLQNKINENKKRIIFELYYILIFLYILFSVGILKLIDTCTHGFRCIFHVLNSRTKL